MRLLKVTIPLGAAIAVFGIFLMIEASVPAPAPYLPPTRHVVTKVMEKTTGAWSRRVAPQIATRDSLGRPFDLAATLAKGPVFLFFIKDDCPCSVDAQPLFNHLGQKFDSRVTFVGVIDAGAAAGRKWAKINAMRYILLPDPKKQIIHAYKASNSAFSALVIQDGTIEKMWPGYSRDYLLDMNLKMCDALGQQTTPFDPLYAPLAKTAGCYF